jgi:hypothetical protein
MEKRKKKLRYLIVIIFCNSNAVSRSKPLFLERLTRRFFFSVPRRRQRNLEHCVAVVDSVKLEMPNENPLALASMLQQRLVGANGSFLINTSSWSHRGVHTFANQFLFAALAQGVAITTTISLIILVVGFVLACLFQIFCVFV